MGQSDLGSAGLARRGRCTTLVPKGLSFPAKEAPRRKSHGWALASKYCRWRLASDNNVWPPGFTIALVNPML
jgi:hypothetical protein